MVVYVAQFVLACARRGQMAKLNARRIFKSSIPIGTLAFFTLLVAFHLYHRPIKLGNLQHVKWQAYDIVSPGNVTTSTSPTNPSNGSADWWDVEDNNSQPVSTSFRLDIWNPLTPHRTGSRYHISLRLHVDSDQIKTSPSVTEIAIRPCLFPPGLLSYCNPRE